MGKRFGRNQKRRMRQDIDALTKSLDEWKYRACSIHQQGFREFYEAQIRYQNVANALKRFQNSALLPANELLVSELPPIEAIHRLNADLLKHASAVFDPSQHRPISKKMMFVDVNRLGIAIRRHEESFQNHVHLTVKGEGKYAGQWVYCFSDSVAVGMPSWQYEELANQIARDLLAQMKKHWAASYSLVNPEGRFYG